MNIKLVKPRDYWLSPYTVIKFLSFGKFKSDSVFAQNLEPVLKPISKLIQKVCLFFEPKDKVIIHNYDLWDLDYSLSKIILPSLLRLQENKGGSPLVDDCDVPECIRSTNDKSTRQEWDLDKFYHDRWTFVIEEMIFSFENILSDECEFNLSEEDQKRIENGLILFGKYYRALWT